MKGKRARESDKKKTKTLPPRYASAAQIHLLEAYLVKATLRRA